MSFLLLGLVAYIIYIPILYLLLVLAIKKYKGYSIRTFLVSQLGEKESPWRPLFNTSLALFGFLSLFFVVGFTDLLPNSMLSQLGVVSLYLTCLGTIFGGIFARDKQTKHHSLSGLVMFTGVGGSALFLIQPIYSSNQIPNFLVFLNFLLLIFLGLFILSSLTYLKNKNFLNGILGKNQGLWEWLTFLLAVTWDFLMASITLLNNV